MRWLDQDDSRVRDKKALYSRYILEVKLIGIKCESKVFDLRNWKIKLPLPKIKKLKEADIVGKTRIQFSTC